MRGKSSLRRLAGEESGAAAVEFAMVGSIFIAIVLAIIQIGWALQVRNELSLVADAAGRTVMLDPRISDSTLEANIRAELPQYSAERLTVEAGEDEIGSTTMRTISIRYQFAVLVPGFPDALALGVSRRVPVL